MGTMERFDWLCILDVFLGISVMYFCISLIINLLIEIFNHYFKKINNYETEKANISVNCVNCRM